MTKNDFELAQSLAVFIDARKHIHAYPSIAEDTGTTERTFIDEASDRNGTPMRLCAPTVSITAPKLDEPLA